MQVQKLGAAALFVLAGFPVVARAQVCPEYGQVTQGVAAPLAYVRYLADDALEGRLGGSPGERCAGDFIAAGERRNDLRAHPRDAFPRLQGGRKGRYHNEPSGLEMDGQRST